MTLYKPRVRWKVGKRRVRRVGVGCLKNDRESIFSSISIERTRDASLRSSRGLNVHS